MFFNKSTDFPIELDHVLMNTHKSKDIYVRIEIVPKYHIILVRIHTVLTTAMWAQLKISMVNFLCRDRRLTEKERKDISDIRNVIRN